MTFTDILKEYFRWTENREPEGFLSWQHLTYATFMVALTVFLAVFLGRKFRNCTPEEKDRVVKVAAVVIVCCELFKIVLISIRAHDPWKFRSMLPLFLCSINLFTIPIAAFCRGKFKEYAQDSVFMYGCLCMLAGSYLAANYFDGSPVLSFDPMMSVTTHCIAGFCSLYLGIAGCIRARLRCFLQSLLLIVGIEGIALLANLWNRGSDGEYESNYMFLSNSAGTPFEIFNTIAGGNQILYTLQVAASYLVYALLFIGVYALILRAKPKAQAVKEPLP